MSARSRPSRVVPALIWLMVPITTVLVVTAIYPSSVSRAWRTAVEATDADRPTGETSNTGQSTSDPARRPSIFTRVLATSPVSLEGSFTPRDETTQQATGSVTLEHARITTELGGLDVGSEPVRILQGRDAIDQEGSFSARFGMGRSEQVELRRVRQLSADAPALTGVGLCQGQTPGLVALWPGRDRMVMVVWPEGAGPGPDSPRNAACGIWNYRR